MSRCLILLILLLAATPALAQRDSAAALDPVIVTVTRGSGRSVLGSPFALTVTRPDSARPGQRHSAVDETLALVPGLSATNRNNPSQDSRLSIRGFGARSAFGVRGVRVLRDGMPLTLPDGQTPLDYMSLESVGRIEVMRGSASALYGNASGGVIDIRSREPSPSMLSFDARQWFGSDEYYRSAVALNGTAGPLSYVADVGRTQTDGSRAHARQRATSGFAKGGYTAGATSYSLMMMALDNPLSLNPGALTLDEMQDDPRLADPQSIRRGARKAVKQFQLGGSAIRAMPRGELSLSAFGGARSLDNPLAFAIVEIGRHSYGASAALRQTIGTGAMQHRFAAGIDFQSLNDLRRNYAICTDTVSAPVPTPTCPQVGSERGIVTLDQRELVSSIGAYLSDELELSRIVSVTAGIRADRVRFEVRDRLTSSTNPDDSGDRTLGSLSPIAGIVARIDPFNSLYANVATVFETPTATELGNQPDGSAGINSELDPQRAVTIEGGAKGFAGRGLRYDVAVFTTSVRDELVPFEIPGSNGRRYFRNAGKTSRRGAEIGGDLSAGPMTLMLAYNYSRFRFVNFTSGNSDFSGNEIPGIPQHRAQAALTLSRAEGFVSLETELAGSTFADDANTVRSSGYSVFHARAGFTPWRKNPRVSVTVGVQNIFDRTYASSLAVNAARGRYYEPASPRALFAGVSIGGEARR
jgi:iron complex outermembrane receptor protein